MAHSVRLFYLLSGYALVNAKAVTYRIAFIWLVGLIRNKLPLPGIVVRKAYITFNHLVYVGDIQPVRKWEKQPVNIRTTYDKYLFIFRTGHRLIYAMNDGASLCLVSWIPSQNDILSTRQGATNILVIFSTHDNRMTDGNFFKVLQVCGKLPGQRIVTANHAVFGNCCDDGDHLCFCRGSN
jgi:hypothetical protein